MKRSIILFTIASCFGGLLWAGPTDDKLASVASAVAVADTDSEAAAKQVAQDNSAAADSLPWYQQSSIKFIDYALYLRAVQDDAGARRAAVAALKVLAHGHGKAASTAGAGDRAQTYVQMAQIYDLLLGDRANAEDCYNRALAEDPTDPIAKRGAAKMESEKREHGGK